MNNIPSAIAISEFLTRARDAASESLPTGGANSFEKLGERWRELGLVPGDLILLSLPNGLALLEQFFGALNAGYVPVMIAPNTPAARIRELAAQLRARAVAAPRLNPVSLGVHGPEKVGVLEAGLFQNPAPSLTKPGEVVLLTSGTSGFASGCVFGIDQLLLNGQRHADAIGQRPDDKVLVNLPLHYSFALVAQMLGTFARGGQLVIDGPPFNPVHYARIVGEYGINVTALTPILARTLLRAGDKAAHSPRVLSVGGDSLGSEDVSRLLEHRPGKELYLTYGLTQAGPRVSTLAAHAEPVARYTSVGRPLAGTTVSFRPVRGDAATQELVVTSATVMRRRIGIVEGRTQQEDCIAGTVATGDVFDHDGEGYLFFRARLSDFIIKQGEKISLAGVRTVAKLLPNVINAKTKVVRSETGDEDFDLTLYVSTDGANSADLLRKQLRRTEMPREIHVEQGDRNSVPGHK